LNKDGDKQFDEDINADIDRWIGASGRISGDHRDQDLDLSGDLNSPSLD